MEELKFAETQLKNKVLGTIVMKILFKGKE